MRTLLREIRETWGMLGARESGVLGRLIERDLLILDEVDMQFGGDAELLRLFDVLNGRYEALRPTVLASNLSVEALPGCLGARLMYRLRENGGVVVPFTWASERGGAAGGVNASGKSTAQAAGGAARHGWRR